MKKLLKTLSVLTLGACLLSGVVLIEAPQTVQAEQQKEVDEIVEIKEGTEFLKMSKEDKEKAYAELDRVNLSTKATTTPLSYPQIQEITSEEAYTKMILASKDTPFIIYFGFDECPYCKAFSPKLNQLAAEMDVPIYYYNTRQRNNDPNFKTVIESYKIQTVPHAFIVHNAKPTEKINHASTMADIETFVAKFKEIAK